MDSQSVLALAIATIIILAVQALLFVAIAAHLMSRTFDSEHTSDKHDAEDQKSGPPLSVPYNATHTPPATPKVTAEDARNEVVEEPFDDTDSLYRMPTPPPKKKRKDAAVNGADDGSSSIYSEHVVPEPADVKGGSGKVNSVDNLDSPETSNRKRPASQESDYGPVTYRY